ncbi:MAG: barstar family protein [Sneathiella sp.]|nr:barstar family protein [Sneathiella sp.]
MMKSIEQKIFGDLGRTHIYLTEQRYDETFVSSECLFVLFDSKKMQNYDNMFFEMQLKLQFPDYYNNNFGSLDECVCDLEWLRQEEIVLYFASSQELLSEETLKSYRILISILAAAGKEWNSPDPYRSDLEQSRKKFSVILNFDAGYFKQFWDRLSQEDFQIGLI